MYKSTIHLASIDAVKKFIALTNKYPFPINLTTDKYKIDAKSSMGVFSLDLSKPVTIEVEADDCQKFMEELRPFQGQQES